MEDVIFDDTLRLAGWLLAHQVHAAEKGDSLLPVMCFNHEDLDSPKVVTLKVDSGSHEDVMAGRALISDQGSQWRSWALAYGEDLGPSGRALLVEVGGKDFGDVITFAQRYTPGTDHGFRLLGDLELVGQELLPAAANERLESRAWRYLIAEGATNHDHAGPKWQTWYSARDHTQAQLDLDEFRFIVPPDWSFRRAHGGKGWLLLRLLPSQYHGSEPIIMAVLLTYPDQATLEEVIEGKKAELIGSGKEGLKAEMFQLPSASRSTMAGRLSWNAETEGGQSARTEWVWVSTDVPGRFLVLSAVSFHVESWEGLVQAVAAVLASLTLPERESAGRRKAGGDSKQWLRKLWQSWRS